MRWRVLAASVLMQMCLGGVYAWSVFVPLLKNTFGFSTAQTQIIFGLTIITFSIAMIPAGLLQDRYGPKIIGAIGGLLYGTGFLIGSFETGSFHEILIGIGLISGAGIGFGYVCPLATCIKWFPEHKGLVTGISVAGFGGAAIILTAIVKYFSGNGASIQFIFRFLASVYGSVIFLSALFLKIPAQKPEISTQYRLSSVKFFFEPAFWALFIGMFSGTFSGLMIIGNLNPIGKTFNFQCASASAGISFFAAGNAVGRILWGRIFDAIGRRSIPLSLIALSISSASFLFNLNSVLIFYIISFIIGFSFGSCFVLYAAQVAVSFGSNRLGTIYPYIFLSYGFSAVTGPPLGGWIHDISGEYFYAIISASALCVIGAFIFHLLTRNYCKSDFGKI